MTRFSSKRADAAKWIYARRNQVDWWRWHVLTSHNPDKDTLALSDKDAFLIFADFVHDGLLVPTIGDDGREAFTINPGKVDRWNQYRRPICYWMLSHLKSLIVWLISVVVAIFIGWILNKLVT